MRRKQEIWQRKETHERNGPNRSHISLTVFQSDVPRILTNGNQPPHSLPGSFGAVWRAGNCQEGEGPRSTSLSVTNFTLCREKSTETLDFPTCHALLLNTERLVHVLNAPRKQLWLRNVHTIPTCSTAKWQPGKTPAGRQDNARS